MKIIATISTGVLLIEASSDELAKIMGFAGESYLKDRGRELTVGREIKVASLYRALEVSRGRKTEIATLAEQLRKAAGRVDSINQALAEPIVEVEKAA